MKGRERNVKKKSVKKDNEREMENREKE